MPLTSQHLYTLSIQHVVHDIKHQLQSNPIFAISFIHLKKTRWFVTPRFFWVPPRTEPSAKKSTNPLSITFQDDQGFGLEKDRATATLSKTVANTNSKKEYAKGWELWLFAVDFLERLIFVAHDFFFQATKRRLKERFWGVFFCGSKKKVPIEFVYCWKFYLANQVASAGNIFETFQIFARGHDDPYGMIAGVWRKPF